MEKLENLHGKELDTYGESIGLNRYVGLYSAETDKQYRESIKAYLKENNIEETKTSNEKKYSYIASEKEWYQIGQYHKCDGPVIIFNEMKKLMEQNKDKDFSYSSSLEDSDEDDENYENDEDYEYEDEDYEYYNLLNYEYEND